MTRPLPPLDNIMRLLVVKTSSLGDVIHALPVLQAIREAAPHLMIGWVVRRRCAELLQGNPNIDQLYEMPDRPSPGELLTLRQALQADRYDVALDMQGLALSGLVTRLSGAEFRVGWDRNREFNARFLTHPIVAGKASDRHEIDLLAGFGTALGVPVPPGEFPPQPYLAEADLAQAEDWLASLSRPRVVLNVGASRAYKRWPAGRWADTARALMAAGLGVVFVGDRADAQVVAEVAGSLTGRFENFVNLAGRTDLHELAAVLAACDLVVTGDSGPMHIAVAVGTPTVALFGATDPARHGPYGRRSRVLHNPVPGAMVPGKRPTPEAGEACMAAIDVRDVTDAVQNHPAVIASLQGQGNN